MKPSISVIIAFRNARTHLDRCLAAITRSQHPNYELILVDDASTDESPRIARRYTDRIITLPSGSGPATARNRAAEQACAEILFFVDADVLCFPNTLEIVEGIFQQNPDLDAVIGSYDDDPPETNFLSRYKNLTHHFVHQRSSTEASTFWTGCGGIRRQVFMSMKGFDESYRMPSIEDIELGYRLKRAGKRIQLCKELVVKHAKRWTFPVLLHSDVLGRAIPWTVLQLSYGELLDDLNVERSQRASAFLICLGVFFGLSAIYRWWVLLGVVPCVIPVLYWNRELYRFYYRCGGLWFAFRATMMHWLYYTYSALSFGVGFIKYRLGA